MLPWILGIIVGIVVLRYAYLLIKRGILIRKINQKIKKNSGSIQYCRNPFVSVFKHDGKTDFTISLPEKTVDISVVTTPLRRVRYHFDMNSKLLELIVERRAVYVVNHKVANGFSSMDRVYTIWKYNIDFKALDSENPKYIILNPAPRSISRAEGTVLESLGNNDILVNGIKICGLKWFTENVISVS